MPLIGLDHVVFAKMTSDSPEATVYATSKRIPGAITANINPNASPSTLFADDGPFDTATTTGEITLELNMADLTLEVQAEILGNSIDANGIIHRKASDVPPWLAVGFRSLKSNGKYRYTWLTKGKFSLPEQANTTKGDSIEYSTPTITGSFVKRESDDEWQLQADADSESFTTAMQDNWFTAPLVSSIAPPPGP